MSKSADYWRGRFSILADAAHQDANSYINDLETIYRDAERTVQSDLERWYGRFATNNGISLTDAWKMLTTGQMEEFRWTVDQYIKIGEQANLSPEWLKKLENASARFHISRLETIQLQIQQQMELLYGGQLDGLDGLLKDVVSNGYTHTAFEIQKGLGLGWDITALNQRKLETLLSRPWTADNKTFRDRCWENKANLVSGVQSTLTQGLLRGDGLQKITDNIKKEFGVSRYKAGRLAHTETTYFNAQASRETYKDLGIEQIEILETLDRHTCDLCGGLDGTVIPLSQYEPGVTVPPFHPNCRGTTCPHYEDMDGKRIARNAENEVYYVPSSMNYQTWKKTFVDGWSKAGLTAAAVGATMKPKAKKTVDDCTTVEEVEALMREKGWFYKTTLPAGSPFDGNQLLSLQGCDLDVAKEVYKSVDNLFSKLPDFVGELNSINASKLSGGCYAQCSFGLGRGGVGINTTYFSSLDKITRMYEHDLAAGFHPANTTFRSVVTHEFGHAVDDFLSHTEHLVGMQGWKPKTVSAYLRPRVMKACGLKVSDARSAVSGYATQDAQEWFAECFCEWMDSPNPRPVAAEFGRQLTELMKGWKK